jgi:hypothetical protein
MDLKSRALALVMALSAGTLLAGCGGGSPATSTSSPPSKPAVAPDPSIREAATAAPSFDVGHTVHVTAAGPQPRSLASECCKPVVFKNETGSPVSIVFFISNIDSGPIAPGASWQWTPPNPESVGYHLGSDASKTGHIQVEATNG